MSRLVLTDVGRRVLLGGWPSEMPNADNPFVVTDGHTYLRFDEITLRSRHPHPGVEVVYSFCGRELFVQAAEHYEPGMSLHLSGLEGKMSVWLSDQ